MLRAILVCLIAAANPAAMAGEIEHARVERKDGEYRVELAASIRGNRDAVYIIATDYEQLSRLSSLIIDSGMVERIEADGTPVTRRRIVMRACVVAFCFNATLIEDILEPATGIIRTVFIPEQSDFDYGEAVWRLSRIDDDNTMIEFSSRFRPAFWVPPLLGPYLIKRMVLGAAEETIMNIETLATGARAGP